MRTYTCVHRTQNAEGILNLIHCITLEIQLGVGLCFQTLQVICKQNLLGK